MKFKAGESWAILSPIEQSIKAKIEAVGTPLKDWDIKINRGVLTGLNEAFIIDKLKRDELIAKDPKSAEIIRPILRGKDIKRNSYSFSDQYVILAYFGSHKVIPEEYPAIYEWLKQFEEKLKKRGQCRYTSSGKPNPKAEYPGQHHWLELDNNPRQEYMDDFSRQKILYREISDKMDAVLDNDGYFVNNKCYLITGEYLRFLCGFLNSKMFDVVLKQVNTTGGKGPEFMKSLAVHKPSGNDFTPSDEELYEIYDLTEAEINFISSSVS